MVGLPWVRGRRQYPQIRPTPQGPIYRNETKNQDNDAASIVEGAFKRGLEPVPR
jgi:hypothetical protein